MFDHRIVAIISKEDLIQFPINETIDAEGCYVSPGFIDIHTHGIAGHDVMDSDEKGLSDMCRRYSASGVTGVLATTMTMDINSIRKAVCILNGLVKEKKMKVIIGCHLEGPFISKSYPGAQNTEYIIQPDISLIEEFKDVIRLVTIAPELSGAKEFIQACVDRNITVSIGHSSATYEEAIEAIKIGAKSITHTFNAMTPLQHRNPGVVGAAMEETGVYCELIADNIHIHPAVQRILLNIKGIDNIILVSDSMRAAAMSEGIYELGGQPVEVKDRSARLKDGTLAGSILTLDEALRNFKNNTGISIEDVVKTVTVNPSKLIGLDHKKGSLDKEKDADITIFDDEINIRYTFCEGDLCYRKKD